jgi:hypothetical protein
MGHRISRTFRDRIFSSRELMKCFDKLKESLRKAVIDRVGYELEIMYGIDLASGFSYKCCR